MKEIVHHLRWMEESLRHLEHHDTVGLGFRGLGFRGLGFRGLGFRV